MLSKVPTWRPSIVTSLDQPQESSIQLISLLTRLFPQIKANRSIVRAGKSKAKRLRSIESMRYTSIEPKNTTI